MNAKPFFLTYVIASMAAVAHAQTPDADVLQAKRAFPDLEPPDHILNIWPNDPPGEKRDLGPEEDVTKDTDALIAGRRIIKLGNVTTPQAHVFLAPENVRTAMAEQARHHRCRLEIPRPHGFAGSAMVRTGPGYAAHRKPRASPCQRLVRGS